MYTIQLRSNSKAIKRCIWDASILNHLAVYGSFTCTCNHWTIHKVGNEVTSLGDRSRNNGGGGGGEDVLEEPHGVWEITQPAVCEMLISNEGVPRSKGKGVPENPIENSRDNWKLWISYKIVACDGQ